MTVRKNDAHNFQPLEAKINIQSQFSQKYPMIIMATPISVSISTFSRVTVSPESHHSGDLFWPALHTPTFRAKTFRVRNSNLSNGKPSNDDYKSKFLNEEGVIEDMDGYLNYLSLEYDSVWDTKPAWCQPWTITLTGLSVIAVSWVILRNVLATSAAATLIGAWWYIFLYSYPKSYTEMIAERRKKVTSGVEDTFGLRNSP